MNLTRIWLACSLGAAAAGGASGQAPKKGGTAALTDHVATELAEPPSAVVRGPAPSARKVKAVRRKGRPSARRAKADAAETLPDPRAAR